MKVGSRAKGEAQERFCADSAGVTLEPPLCRWLAGTALQNSQNTDHIRFLLRLRLSCFTLFSAPTTPFSGRKAGQEEGQGAGDDLKTTATVQSLTIACAPAAYAHGSSAGAGAGPAHMPNSNLGFSISTQTNLGSEFEPRSSSHSSHHRRKKRQGRTERAMGERTGE